MNANNPSPPAVMRGGLFCEPLERLATGANRMQYAVGQRVRINPEHLARIKDSGYFRDRDAEPGVISKMLNSKIAQVEIPGDIPHRLLHVANIEHA
jgi:hypothetical protein